MSVVLRRGRPCVPKSEALSPLAWGPDAPWFLWAGGHTCLSTPPSSPAALLSWRWSVLLPDCPAPGPPGVWACGSLWFKLGPVAWGRCRSCGKWHSMTQLRAGLRRRGCLSAQISSDALPTCPCHGLPHKQSCSLPLWLPCCPTWLWVPPRGMNVHCVAPRVCVRLSPPCAACAAPHADMPACHQDPAGACLTLWVLSWWLSPAFLSGAVGSPAGPGARSAPWTHLLILGGGSELPEGLCGAAELCPQGQGPRAVHHTWEVLHSSFVSAPWPVAGPGSSPAKDATLPILFLVLCSSCWKATENKPTQFAKPLDVGPVLGPVAWVGQCWPWMQALSGGGGGGKPGGQAWSGMWGQKGRREEHQCRQSVAGALGGMEACLLGSGS